MKYLNLHPWDVSPNEARRIQEDLKDRIDCKDSIKLNKINTIAACDASFKNGSVKGCVCVFTYPSLKMIETVSCKMKVRFPYIPGLLTFREGPVILRCLGRIRQEPDLVIFDGQGIAHPKRMGIATHLGIILDKPTIGCAKSLLYGKYILPGIKKGSYTYILNDKNDVIGACLRTRDNIKPVFVSYGYKISLETSVKLILSCVTKYRIPEPVRSAHRMANED